MKLIQILLITFFCTCNVMAQPFTLNKNVKPVLLNLIPYTAKDTILNGKKNTTDVVQVEDTSYYYVKGLSIYQPVVLNISSTDVNNKMIIQIAKDNWKTPDKIGSLNSKGIWQATFKTEGSFGIQVIAPKKTIKYKIVVWVGNEPKKINMPSPFKEATAAPSKAPAAAKTPPKTKTTSKSKSKKQ